jgi:UDPglucose 6-dehydrogenase
MFGAGYVGLVTGACFADLGHEVVIRDVVPERIERLQAGEVPSASASRSTSARRFRVRSSSTSQSAHRRRSPGTPTCGRSGR